MHRYLFLYRAKYKRFLWRLGSLHLTLSGVGALTVNLSANYPRMYGLAIPIGITHQGKIASRYSIQVRNPFSRERKTVQVRLPIEDGVLAALKPGEAGG